MKSTTGDRDSQESTLEFSTRLQVGIRIQHWSPTTAEWFQFRALGRWRSFDFWFESSKLEIRRKLFYWINRQFGCQVKSSQAYSGAKAVGRKFCFIFEWFYLSSGKFSGSMEAVDLSIFAKAEYQSVFVCRMFLQHTIYTLLRLLQLSCRLQVAAITMETLRYKRLQSNI